MRKAAASVALVTGLLCAASAAEAGCRFGQKDLPGSLGPGQTEDSRSFTVNGTALFAVRVTSGGPIVAHIGCGWSTAGRHACRVYGDGELFVRLYNPTGRQIRYRWICRH